MTVYSLTPILPTLEVKYINDRIALKNLYWDMVGDPSVFRGISEDDALLVKVVGSQLVIPTSDPRAYPRVIAEVYDYEVRSSNGLRCVAVDRALVDSGDLRGIPADLLVPGEATVVQE